MNKIAIVIALNISTLLTALWATPSGLAQTIFNTKHTAAEAEQEKRFRMTLSRRNNDFSAAEVKTLTDVCEGWLKNSKQIEARKVMTRVLKSNHCGAYQYCVMGASFIGEVEDSSDFASARKYLNQALKADPSFAETYFCLALVEQGANHHTEALKLLDKALSFGDKSYHPAWKTKASVLSALGRKEEAYKAACQAEKLSPHDAGALWVKAGILEQMDKPYEAAKLYQKSYQFYQSDWLLHQIIHCLEESKHYDEALLEIKKLMLMTPDDPDAYRLRANIYRKQARLDKALADMNKVIEMEPTSVAYKDRANIYKLMNNPDKAKLDLQAAAKLIE